jgi:tetratricopeptide (TPR) repeat protein
MPTPSDATELPETVARALALLGSGDHQAALKLLDAHLLEFPACERGYCARGSTRREAGQLDEATQDFDAALTLRPTYARAVFGRGLTKFDLDDHEGAFADFAAAVAIEPEPGFFAYWGERLARMGRHGEAIERFDDCIQQSEPKASSFLNRGMSHADLGNVPASIADLERAAALDPANLNAHKWLARQLDRAEQFHCAARSLDHAISLASSDGSLRYHRGCVLFKVRDYEAATRDMTAAIALGYDGNEVYYWRGRALHELDDDVGAAADQTTVLSRDPRDGNALVARGDAYLALDEPELALADFARACEVDPSEAGPWVRRACAQVELGGEGSALASLDIALALDPKKKSALRIRCELHAVNGNDRLAEADLDALAQVHEEKIKELPMAQRQLRTSVLLADHFGEIAAVDLAITERQFPFRVRADLQRAMDELFASSQALHFSGVKKEHSYEGVAFSDLLFPTPHYPALAVPAEYEEVDIGESEPMRCLKNGLWLIERQRLRYAVFVTPARHHGESVGLNIQIAAPQGEAGAQLTQETFKLLEEAVLRSQSYRGKILSLEKGDRYRGMSSGIRVHKLRTVERDQVILPATTLELLDRNVIQFARQRARLGELGLSTKKGLLFYGPPGTGKTHTIHYLARAMDGHTTLLISAEQVGLLGEYMTLARLLQPSIVVIEDADLIARDRNRMESACEEVLLNKLLNEMDGLRPDTEVLFILTTNRPETLEGALASRPGRIDQAIEFPLPDEVGRRKLVHLYARGLQLTDEVVETAVRRTERVSASFIKELMRRAAQFLIEREGDSTLSVADLDRALDELLFAGGSLNCRFLGLQESEA